MLKRESPLKFDLAPERVVERDGWEIPLSYVGEMKRNALFVADLSPVPKWSVQGPELGSLQLCGLSIPERPRAVSVSREGLVARLTPSEARLMVFRDNSFCPTDPRVTDVTDGSAAMAVVGPSCYALLSKLSSVDLGRDAAPSAVMAPLEDVTCLIVQLRGERGIPGLILTGPRGYGHFLLDAVLNVGREYGIAPAGWERFQTWLG